MDQIEELGLDSDLYLRILAETLATLYWRVHVDANDVEFVLAPQDPDLSSENSTHATIFDSSILGKQ